MSVKIKTDIRNIPNIWYMECPDESELLLSAAYDLSEKRLFLLYAPKNDKSEQWFLYEEVPSKWWRDFTMASDKDAFVRETRKKDLVNKHRVHLLI